MSVRTRHFICAASVTCCSSCFVCTVLCLGQQYKTLCVSFLSALGISMSYDTALRRYGGLPVKRTLQVTDVLSLSTPNRTSLQLPTCKRVYSPVMQFASPVHSPAMHGSCVQASASPVHINWSSLDDSPNTLICKRLLAEKFDRYKCKGNSDSYPRSPCVTPPSLKRHSLLQTDDSPEERQQRYLKWNTAVVVANMLLDGCQLPDWNHANKENSAVLAKAVQTNLKLDGVRLGHSKLFLREEQVCVHFMHCNRNH